MIFPRLKGQGLETLIHLCLSGCLKHIVTTKKIEILYINNIILIRLEYKNGANIMIVNNCIDIYAIFKNEYIYVITDQICATEDLFHETTGLFTVNFI